MATGFRAGLLLAAILTAMAAGPASGNEPQALERSEKPYLPSLAVGRPVNRQFVYNPHVRRATMQTQDAAQPGADASRDELDMLLEGSSSPSDSSARDTTAPSSEAPPTAAESDDGAPEAMELPSPEAESQQIEELGGEETPLMGQPTANWDEVPAGPDLPAPVCSSRNLLQPGCFYAQADAIYATRVMRKGDRILAVDTSPTNAFVLLTTNESLGWTPGTRLTFGKYLGRDAKCRDYNVEFTYFGLFDWTDRKGISSYNPTASLIDTVLDPGRSVQAFNDAAHQEFEYKSQFDSFEANIRVAERLSRDRMELQPNGAWIRRCDPGLLHTFIVGARTVHVDERFTYLSQGLNPALQNGTYIVDTSNELYGAQAGCELMYQQCKWRVGARFKTGLYANFAEQDTFVRIVDAVAAAADPPDRREHASDDVLSWLGELNLEAAYHIRPNLAVRAGYELTMLNEAALALDQVTFAPETPPDVLTSGFLAYHGFSLGLELYW